MEGKIYAAIAAVMADVGAVGKDAENTFDRYKYRSIDAVMNAMHPAMAKHNVFVVPEVLEQTRENRASRKGEPLTYSVTKVRYTFYTVDGSQVTATVVGEGMDRGDKSMNKAMSAAFKYALFQVFCIPTEEMVDSETESPEPKAQQPQPQQKTAAKGKRETNISVEELDKKAQQGAAPAKNATPTDEVGGAQDALDEMCTEGELALIKEIWEKKTDLPITSQNQFKDWPKVTKRAYVWFMRQTNGNESKNQ